MATGQSEYFQIKTMTPNLRHAMRVAAALKNMTMNDYAMWCIEKQVKQEIDYATKEDRT